MYVAKNVIVAECVEGMLSCVRGVGWAEKAEEARYAMRREGEKGATEKGSPIRLLPPPVHDDGTGLAEAPLEDLDNERAEHCSGSEIRHACGPRVQNEGRGDACDYRVRLGREDVGARWRIEAGEDMPCRADIATMAVLEEPLGASWVFQGVKEAFWVLKI